MPWIFAVIMGVLVVGLVVFIGLMIVGLCMDSWESRNKRLGTTYSERRRRRRVGRTPGMRALRDQEATFRNLFAEKRIERERARGSWRDDWARLGNTRLGGGYNPYIHSQSTAGQAAARDWDIRRLAEAVETDINQVLERKRRREMPVKEKVKVKAVGAKQVIKDYAGNTIIKM